MSKISIIIPVYNVEKYLAKCLDSAINQTLKEIEIIVINDGSTDHSQQIIDQYKKKDDRIISITKENGGLSDARNYGIEKASGEYIAFLDSDDWIEAEMLKTMYEKAKEHQADIVVCGLEKINEEGEVIKVLPQSPQLPEKIELDKDFTIFGEISCFACNKIYKRNLWDKHRFVKGLHFEDIELIPKLFIDSKIIVNIPVPFYKYLDRQGSITRNHTEKGLDMFTAVRNVSAYFKQSNYNENLEELKRFQILQAYYSFVAYYARVRNRRVKKEMKKALINFLYQANISKSDIVHYRRFNKNYIYNLPILQKVYYFLNLSSLNIKQH